MHTQLSQCETPETIQFVDMNNNFRGVCDKQQVEGTEYD